MKNRAKYFGLLIALASTLSPGRILAQQPIVLRDMGSFHIGGQAVEVSGQPPKEIVFTPGGVPAKIDLNGTYQIAQMYAQYFPRRCHNQS